jgi:hypothetical protein
MRAGHVMDTLFDQAGANIGTQLLTDQSCPVKIGLLVNIDHRCFFNISVLLEPRRESLGKSAKRQFDPQALLAKVGTGKTVVKFRKGRIIYAQGEEADFLYSNRQGQGDRCFLAREGSRHRAI